jgi:hypothetical protein
VYGTPAGYGTPTAPIPGTPGGPPAGAPSFLPPDSPGGGYPGAQYSAYTPPPQPPRKSRRTLIILLVVAAILIVGAGVGTAITLSLDANSGSNFAINSCVKQDGTKAQPVQCSDPNAFVITNKVDKQDRCPDQNQPFVVVQRGGAKDEILCLRPANPR